MNIKIKELLDYLIDGINKSQSLHREELIESIDDLTQEMAALREDLKKKDK